MKILIITQYFPPEIGAAASRWGDYVKILIKQGHHVTVLCEMPNYPQGKYFHGYKRKWLLKEKFSQNLIIIRSASWANDRSSALKKLIHYLMFMFSGIINVFKIKNHDLVIVSSPPLFCGVIGLILKKCKSIEFWLDVRDIWPESALVLNQIKKNWIYFLGKKLESTIYNSAKGFIFPVPGFKKYFNREFNNQLKKPMFDLINGISDDFIISTKEKDEKPDKRFTVLYSGNMGLSQGLEIIIEVAGLLKKYPIDFRLIGNGVCNNKLKKLAKIKKIDNVFFHNSINRFELIKWIKKSSICLVPLINHPLFRSALPSKMFEYMACGRPMIVGIKGEAEKLINISKSGVVVEPENPILLSKAIINYYNDSEKCINDGKNGMTYVTENLKKEELISVLINNIQLEESITNFVK